MKKKTCLFAVLVLVLSGMNSQARTNPAEDTAKPEGSAERPRPQLVFGLHGTLSNSYSRGNLDTWFGERTGDPSREVDQGSPAFWGLEAAVFLPVKEDAVLVGASMGFVIPASHSLWGTQLYFGGRQELVLNPAILSVALPIKLQLGNSGRLYGTLAPSMLMGWVTGSYTSVGTDLVFTASPSFGFGLTAEAETMFSRMLGLDLRLGFRVLKADLAFENASSTTGYSQPLLNNGEEVQADLGGTYMTVGVSIHL